MVNVNLCTTIESNFRFLVSTQNKNKVNPISVPRAHFLFIVFPKFMFCLTCGVALVTPRPFASVTLSTAHGATLSKVAAESKQTDVDYHGLFQDNCLFCCLRDELNIILNKQKQNKINLR